MHTESTATREGVPIQTGEPAAKSKYVMRGDSVARELEIYHLIVAPSFRCDLRCAHCYLPSHAPGGLSIKDVLRLADEWSEVVETERGRMGGVFHIKGGEPLLLPYLNEVLEHLAQLRTLRFMMTTNGIRGDRSIADCLQRLNVSLDGNVQIVVSIDGSNDRINAELRGRGNFDKAVCFVRQLRESGITVFLNNVIHVGNLDDIPAFVELAASLDVAQVNFLSFEPKGNGETMSSGSPDVVDVFRRINAIWENADDRVRGMLVGSLSDIRESELSGMPTSGECVGGYRGLLYVVPDGTVYSCPNLNRRDLQAGDVHRAHLREIHKRGLSTVYCRIASPAGTTSDKYVCKGTRFLDSCSATAQPRRDLAPQSMFEGTHCIGGVSYCFNRNW